MHAAVYCRGIYGIDMLQSFQRLHISIDRSQNENVAATPPGKIRPVLVIGLLRFPVEAGVFVGRIRFPGEAGVFVAHGLSFPGNAGVQYVCRM